MDVGAAQVCVQLLPTSSALLRFAICQENVKGAEVPSTQWWQQL